MQTHKCYIITSQQYSEALIVTGMMLLQILKNTSLLDVVQKRSTMHLHRIITHQEPITNMSKLNRQQLHTTQY